MPRWTLDMCRLLLSYLYGGVEALEAMLGAPRPSSCDRPPVEAIAASGDAVGDNVGLMCRVFIATKQMRRVTMTQQQQQQQQQQPKKKEAQANKKEEEVWSAPRSSLPRPSGAAQLGPSPHPPPPLQQQLAPFEDAVRRALVASLRLVGQVAVRVLCHRSPTSRMCHGYDSWAYPPVRAMPGVGASLSWVQQAMRPPLHNFCVPCSNTKSRRGSLRLSSLAGVRP